MNKELNEIFEMSENLALVKHMENLSHEENIQILSTIFSSLVGTCMPTMDTILDDYGLDVEILITRLGFQELEVYEILDENALMCEDCGWWESPDMMEDGVCYECRRDRDD